jgi:hypothetical protein
MVLNKIGMLEKIIKADKDGTFENITQIQSLVKFLNFKITLPTTLLDKS